MNQSLLFNDDLTKDENTGNWKITAILAGECITVYFHSLALSRLDSIDSCTKYDLEEVAELWLEKNEPEGNEIHIEMKA